MPNKIFKVGPPVFFPHPSCANEDGVLAVGGDLSQERLIEAYSRGIFPWPVRGCPLLWFSPDPRFVLPLKDAHISRSLRKRLRRNEYDVRMDTCFPQVMRLCAEAKRPNQNGTWITPGLVRAYTALFHVGLAHSVEAFNAEGTMVGGLYGVSLGNAFFGESMFAHAPDASKVAFATLIECLSRWGFDWIDCQVHTEHLERFGAVEWPRDTFLLALEAALKHPTRQHHWSLSDD